MQAACKVRCGCPQLLAPGTTVGKFIKCQECVSKERDEAWGFIWHGWARGVPTFAISAFFSPYITKLAQFAAAKDAPYDTATWMGFQILPTSYVSISTTIVAVISAIFVPYIGATSDSTPHRRTYLIWFTNVAAALAIACIVVTEDTWHVGGLLSAFSGCFNEWSLTFVYAYLPEVGNSDNARNKVSSRSVLYANIAQLLFIAITVVILAVADPSDLQLQNGTFRDGIASWSFDPNVSVTGCNTSLLQVCTSPSCFTTTGATFDGSGTLTLASSPTPVGIYQDSGNSASSLKSRKGLITGTITSTNVGNCYMRVYQNFEQATYNTHNANSNPAFFAAIFSTDSTTEQLSYEVVSPANATTVINSVDLTTRPTNTVAVMTMVSGFWFLFFAMASYTHFGSRAQSRGDPNAKLSTREFVKQVNSSLWQSVKFCARSLKISSWLIAFAGYQAGMASVVALSGTYLTGQLHLSTSTTGAVLLYAQFVGIPGALIFYFISSKIGLHQALAVAYGIWLLAIVLAFYLWKDQTTPTGNVWFVMTIFGAAGGAALSLARSAFAGLIPQGREAEFMGLFNFSAKIIAWSGTLLFTAVNEATKSFRYAFVSLGSFFVLALLGQIVAALAPMPDFLTVQAVCEFDAAIDDQLPPPSRAVSSVVT